MPIGINGSGTVTGISVGGLPDGIVDTDMLSTGSKQGIAKAWVNFDGSGTLAVRDSFNVDSVTDNGTGDYTVNFTSGALSNANYAIAGSISFESNQSRNILSVATTAGSAYTAATTTVLRLESVNYGNGNAWDCLLYTSPSPRD